MPQEEKTSISDISVNSESVSSETDFSFSEHSVISETVSGEISESAVTGLPEEEVIALQTSVSELFPVGEFSETAVSAPTMQETSAVISESEIEESETEFITVLLSPETTAAIAEYEVPETFTSEYTSETVETAAIVQPETKTRSVNSDMLVGGGSIIVLLAVLGAVIAKSRKRNKNIDESSAKYRDSKRLESEKPQKKKKEKKSKDDKKNLSKTVIETLPYKKILSDNLWYLGNKTYSKAYTFDDINFNLADEEQQYLYMERYIEFLGMLDDSVDCQICLWNNKINMDEFRHRTLMPQKSDEYFKYRFEYNTRVLEENIKKGQNAIQKRMYVTLTIKAPDEEAARRKFKSLDITATNTFDRIGNTNLRVLTSQERLLMLKTFFTENTDPLPVFTEDDFNEGKEKLYICPDYFDFKKDYFMFNGKYAKTVYIREYPSTATSSVFTDLLSTGIEVMITTNIETYDTAEARKLVQRQMTALDTDMAKREIAAAQHGNFSSQMPQRIKNQRDSMAAVFDKITTKDQKLFLTNTQILITADTYEELQNNLEIVQNTLKRSGCIVGEMAWQQEDGMCDCMPVGYMRKFEWLRTMPSESVAILMPFNVKEVQMECAVYYGLNMLSHNIITFDRMTGLINPSGFILGCPGSGKSFTAKREMIDVFLRNPNADILIIDPEREYWKLVESFGGTVVKFSNGSKNYINPFDFDLKLLEDEEIDIIDDKCQLITSFISCMDEKHPLNGQEKSYVDKCVRKAYLKSGVLDTLDPKDMPTLGTFHECMKEHDENVNRELKNKLILTVDMYVNGSARYFNNQTNVDVDNRLISYDIRDLNGSLKTQSMLLILDYIWNRMSRNRDKGRATYVYFDEAHLLFADEFCLDYLKMLWKRARKYGGVLTGITQNVEDLLKDEKSRSMLSNSEFLALLKQNPADAAKLQDVLHFTDSEIQYVKDTPSGHGILVLGGKDKIPFFDEFPKDTELYSKMTTNFSETAKMLHKDESEEEAE